VSRTFFIEPDTCNVDAMELAISSAVKIAKEAKLDAVLILPEKKQLNSKVVRKAMSGLRSALPPRSEMSNSRPDLFETSIKRVKFTISHSGLADVIPKNSVVIGAWGGERILNILDNLPDSYRILLNWNSDKSIFPDDQKEDVWIKYNNAVQIKPLDV
jgi:hypothetical protein